ncbi:hypothetical protein RHSIM_Rhsim10G0115400 [Rhododendron simsii]|uniref:HAT C-terminal dimerisation domain-containing protein n=1 Tax=Rhododendron simsii TaxID=118357 RepID=A0A834L9T5_RHOSS|nr:hypothetical protein RHSIM_Rhsim10G0115400 [Rhododendron simsii]
MRFVSETQRLRSFPVTDVYGEFPFLVTDVNRSGPSLSRRQQEMDPENIHFDNKGLNPDLDDDEPTLPTGRESVGEAASNIAVGPGSSETSSRSELTQYLEINLVTNEEFQSFDILAWWKKTEKTFPILSIMARDLLTPPVSSVASESAFSAGNRVLDERRSRLAPDILDCLICLKDWEDARLGIQKCHPRDEFRDYFSDSDIDAD